SVALLEIERVGAPFRRGHTPIGIGTKRPSTGAELETEALGLGRRGLRRGQVDAVVITDLAAGIHERAAEAAALGAGAVGCGLVAEGEGMRARRGKHQRCRQHEQTCRMAHRHHLSPAVRSIPIASAPPSGCAVIATVREKMDIRRGATAAGAGTRMSPRFREATGPNPSGRAGPYGGAPPPHTPRFASPPAP